MRCPVGWPQTAIFTWNMGSLSIAISMILCVTAAILAVICFLVSSRPTGIFYFHFETNSILKFSTPLPKVGDYRNLRVSCFHLTWLPVEWIQISFQGSLSTCSVKVPMKRGHGLVYGQHSALTPASSVNREPLSWRSISLVDSLGGSDVGLDHNSPPQELEMPKR